MKDVKGEFGASLIENVVALAVIALASVMLLTLFGIVFSGKNNNARRAEAMMEAHSFIDDLTNRGEESNAADAVSLAALSQTISHAYPDWDLTLAETGTARLLAYCLKGKVDGKEEILNGKIYISPAP